MKKLRSYVFTAMLLMSVFCLTACGSGSNSADQSRGETTAATETAMDSGNGREESTGVIDGVMEDVKDGVEDITGAVESEASRMDDNNETSRKTAETK